MIKVVATIMDVNVKKILEILILKMANQTNNKMKVVNTMRIKSSLARQSSVQRRELWMLRRSLKISTTAGNCIIVSY